jgi:hypothetical protein
VQWFSWLIVVYLGIPLKVIFIYFMSRMFHLSKTIKAITFKGEGEMRYLFSANNETPLISY